MILNWRKATYSLSNGNCVEVGTGRALIAVRDSTDPDGPVISVSPGEWAEFTEYVKRVTPRRRAGDASSPSLCAVGQGAAERASMVTRGVKFESADLNKPHCGGISGAVVR